MAIKSTIFKAQLAIADIDHGYYADHALTLARHPSETDERMMVRLAALALPRARAADRMQRRRHAGLRRRPVRPDDPDVSCATSPAHPAVDRGRPARRQADRQGLPQGRPRAAVRVPAMRPKSGGAASRPS
jgi:hypothetical protein